MTAQAPAPTVVGPYRAEFGAIHHEADSGFLFTVAPASAADEVARALNVASAAERGGAVDAKAFKRAFWRLAFDAVPAHDNPGDLKWRLSSSAVRVLADAAVAASIAMEAPTATGAGARDDLNLDDATVQRAISWTLDQVGRQLGADRWDGGDGSESVEGDVGVEISNIMRAAGLVDADGEPLRKETYAALRPSPSADVA